jgi:hypothetical protein
MKGEMKSVKEAKRNNERKKEKVKERNGCSYNYTACFA